MLDHNWNWLEVLCQDFDRARSLTVYLLVKYGEWDQLVKLRCSPSDYCTTLLRFPHYARPMRFQTIDDFRFDYQISELLRKCVDLPLTEVDPVKACLESFWEAEYKCANTNIRLNQLQRQHAGDWFHPAKRIDCRWQEVVKVWRRLVRSVLGSLPDTLTPKFSSGATFDDRRFLLPQDKMSSRPSCTDDAYQIIEPFWGNTLWCKGLTSTHPNRSLPLLRKGDRFTMVPKTAVTHRGICVSPSLNVTYQLSVGKYIRSRLSMQGIDLTYGQAVHQRLAEQASKTLDLATIDLSSASDTVSRELVRLVLPSDWFDLLDSLRCKFTRVPDLLTGKKVWRKLEKFSAMGNGYTFELETLLFFTLGQAVSEVLCEVPDVLTVYGDDIIIDAKLARPLVSALRFFGFIPNPKKTFIDDTPFRESCGGDYYRGFNVRGYYLESLPKEPIDFIKLANGIRRMANPDLDAYGDMYRYKRSWIRVISRIPTRERRCRGPAHYGDICLHDERASWAVKYKGGEKYISTLQPVFDDSATTSYDRKFWTRDSIVAAATLGLLYGQGDSHVLQLNGTWKIIPGRQKIARCEPVGHAVKDIPFSDLPVNNNLKYTDRLLKSIHRVPKVAIRTVNSSHLLQYWTSWLLAQ